MSHRYVFKIFFVTLKGTGLNSLISYDSGNNIVPKNQMGVGVNFSSRKVILENQESAMLQIWSTYFDNMFDITLSTYIFGSQALVLLFDVTNPDTLPPLQNILDLIRQRVPDIPVFLLGNKIDLPYNHGIHENAVGFCRKNKCNVLNYISAKEGNNIDAFFLHLVTYLVDKSKN